MTLNIYSHKQCRTVHTVDWHGRLNTIIQHMLTLRKRKVNQKEFVTVGEPLVLEDVQNVCEVYVDESYVILFCNAIGGVGGLLRLQVRSSTESLQLLQSIEFTHYSTPSRCSNGLFAILRYAERPSAKIAWAEEPVETKINRAE